VSRSRSGEELLHLVDDDVDVPDGESIVSAGHGDKARVLDVVGEVTPLIDRDDRVVLPVDDQRRRPDRRQDVPNVDLEEHAHDSSSRCRACGKAKEASPGLQGSGIARDARIDRSSHVAATPAFLGHRGEALLQLGRCADLVPRRR
jgi:hypothetical protein